MATAERMSAIVCEPRGSIVAMSDESIAGRIERLVTEEHELRNREQVDAPDDDALEADRERLSAVEVELDRCWDLLRQRRALRDAGADPDAGAGARRRHCGGLPAVGGDSKLVLYTVRPDRWISFDSARTPPRSTPPGGTAGSGRSRG